MMNFINVLVVCKKGDWWLKGGEKNLANQASQTQRSQQATETKRDR